MGHEALAGVAKLFGLLLLRELETETLRSLSDPVLSEILKGSGITMPEESELEELAADFFEYFVNPQQGAPLVQSISEGGSYEGDPARDVRKIADAAGVELDPTHLMGAPVDHLAVELALWSVLVERDRSAAVEFTRRHLVWSLPRLRDNERQGFYGNVCRVVADFIEAIGKAS